MRIVSVVGARPQLVKLGPIDAVLRAEPDVDHVIVHTGQHYDPALSDIFFTDLGITAPHYHLGVGSGSHGVQTGAMLARLDDILFSVRPDWTLVYGNANSTLAGALAAVKMRLPVAHIDAGVRSYNRDTPEEHNRVLTDHAADLLLAPTQAAAERLRAEGLGTRTLVVGDVMTDVFLTTRDRVAGRAPALPDGIGPDEPFVVATLHRAENTDDPDRLALLVEALRSLPAAVVLYAHPRLRLRCAEHGIALEGGSLHVAAPLGYSDMVATLLHATGVVTDSGGLQREAYLLGVPCTTVRTETEWPETLTGGWNVLDPDAARLGEHALRPRPSAERGSPYGDGHAAQRVVTALRERAGR